MATFSIPISTRTPQAALPHSWVQTCRLPSPSSSSYPPSLLPSSSEARQSEAWRASRPSMHAWRRHSPRSSNLQPSTHHATSRHRPLRLCAHLHQQPMAAAPSGHRQTAAAAPLFPAPPLLLFSQRCHGSPLHRAAGGVFAGGEANGEEKGYFAHDRFGLGFELEAQAQLVWMIGSIPILQKNPKFNLILQNTCLNHIFINQIIIPYSLFI